MKEKKANLRTYLACLRKAKYAIGDCGIKKQTVCAIARKAMGVHAGDGGTKDIVIAFVSWINSDCDAAIPYKNRMLQGIARIAAKKKASRNRRAEPPVVHGHTHILRAAGIPSIGTPHPDYTDSKVFYASDAWKKLRYLVIKNSSGRCSCCGSRPVDGVTLQVDHIVPRWKEPANFLDTQTCIHAILSPYVEQRRWPPYPC